MKASRHYGRASIEAQAGVVPISQKAATPREMSKIYGIPLGTLANLRYQKRGPKYFRRGRSVLYFFSDFESWVKKNPVLTADSHETEDG